MIQLLTNPIFLGVVFFIISFVVIIIVLNPFKKNSSETNNDKCNNSEINTGTTSISLDTVNVIDTIPSNSIMITNSTSEQYLHVFLQLPGDDIKKPWKQLSNQNKSNAVLRSDPVFWGPNGNSTSWDPLGAKLTQEAVIPKNESIILSLPDNKDTTGDGKTISKAFVIMPIKMTDTNKKDFLDPFNVNIATDRNKWGNGIPKEVVHQQAILIEGGKDMVTDSSAVDGINFRLGYTLTTDGNKTKSMKINNSPCKGLSDAYKKTINNINLDVGCTNPAKIDCKGKPSCDCKPNTQICKFSDCSKTLFKFDTPESKALLDKYTDDYDNGNDGSVANNPPVKKYINNSSNLIDCSPLSMFCKNIQSGTNDFTTYCYDYNDTSSSPYLLSPYKMLLTYYDVDSI
jgi:hypothetical protein